VTAGPPRAIFVPSNIAVVDTRSRAVLARLYLHLLGEYRTADTMINLLTLGRVSISRDGQDLTYLAAHKQKIGLLAYLAVEESVSRDRLLGVFWPERDEERARHSRSQALYALKRELGSEFCNVSGDRVELVPGTVTVDVKELEEAANGERWETVTDLYQGPFLEGVYVPEAPAFDQWLTQTRAWVDRLARRGFIEHIRAHCGRGDEAGALALASRWAALEPFFLEDEAQHALMTLLAKSGDRTAALGHYETFRERLAQVELEPLEATRELVRQIRAGETPKPVLISDAEEEDEPTTEPIEPAKVAPVEREEPPADSDSGDIETLLQQELGPGFVLEEKLGESSTSGVYLAREPALKRNLAVKVFSPALADNPRARMRFEREVQAVASLSHPNIVALHWAGTLPNNLPYFVMEYVKGRTVADKLHADEFLSVEEARRVMREVASALALAHRRGVVHRDVQPSNILLDEEAGRSLLADFGIARILATADTQLARFITKTGELLGDPTYASPEQLQGMRVTDRCDVYSLGLLAFEMLTGRGPFDAESKRDIFTAHIQASPRRVSDFRSDVDGDLVRLIGHCLAKEPEHRPSAADVVHRLDTGRPLVPTPGPEDDSEKSFLTKLVDRRVPHVLAVLFKALQDIGLPKSVSDLMLVTYLTGLPTVAIAAWYHGEVGPQKSRRIEWCLYGILAAIWLVACGLVLF
jgi:serine/threonine-protein kinase